MATKRLKALHIKQKLFTKKIEKEDLGEAECNHQAFYGNSFFCNCKKGSDWLKRCNGMYGAC